MGKKNKRLYMRFAVMPSCRLNSNLPIGFNQAPKQPPEDVIRFGVGFFSFLFLFRFDIYRDYSGYDGTAVNNADWAIVYN